MSHHAPSTRTQLSRTFLALATLAGTLSLASPGHAEGSAPAPLPDMASVAQIIGAQTAWAGGARGAGVDVAVLDTGVTPVTGLSGPGKLVYGPDLSFEKYDPERLNLDGFGHGTVMAGIIAGNDGTPDGYTGIAPDARIVSIKAASASGAIDVSQIVAGIDWVTEHAHSDGLNIRVLNLSLGTDSLQPYQIDPLTHAAENAWRKGIVVVVAVGNDGTSHMQVANPASDPRLLAVGAADPQGTVAHQDDTVPDYSRRGTPVRHADLLAPGSHLMGLLSPGSTLAQTYPSAVRDGRFLRGSGTSQAAAVTSGAVANLLSARPDLTPDQVKRILTSTAVPIATTDPIFAGAGLLQLPAAMAAPTPSALLAGQTFPLATGTGSLEQARGSYHVSAGGAVLSGEFDVNGLPWVTSVVAAAEQTGVTWAGGIYNGLAWTGSGFVTASLTGSQWSGSQWSGSQWSGSQWSGAQWSGSQWSGSQWSGSQWSGSQWSGAQWSGSQWSGSQWSGSQWQGATWD
jgi:serine protease AprX